jgi:hypothetical protein
VRKRKVAGNYLYDTVKGLVGDEGFVADIKLEKRGGVAPVKDGLIGAGPGDGQVSGVRCRVSGVRCLAWSRGLSSP